ncbi:flagellar hook-length control protein FliK [Shimia sp. FJ5]|nr:flagellar hook-length control protein FliK [Shimia sp. FJ5]MDV4144724.1 flagellar hook-length control protein FliK [Shimia sp. FJ5]
MFQSVRGAALGPHAEHPQALSVVRQVSEAIRLTPGNGIDIALRPEELGSVRLSLSGQEGQMSVVVQAERPETLDLMRRHIDSLSQEFRAIGYGDVSFSFQSGGDSARDEQDGEPGTVAVIEEMPSDDTRGEASGSIAKRSGLDMRI